MTTEKRPKGRPTIPDADRRDKTVRARVTVEQEAKFNRLGGADWLRGKIDKTKEKPNG